MLKKILNPSNTSLKSIYSSQILSNFFSKVPKSEPNFLEMVGLYFEQASQHMDIPHDQLTAIKKPSITLKQNLKVTMDDGSIKSFEAYRCQHNAHYKPCKGGIRISPHVNQQEVEALGTLMTLKCSALLLPYGGGKGGICADPHELSITELERLWRAYAFAYSKRGFISPSADVVAPDMNSGPREMAWIADTYLQMHGDNDQNALGICTGKPLELDGVDGRTEATGLGLYYCARNILNDPHYLKKAGLSKGIKGKTFIVQGFGNVGSWFARFIHENGGKVQGIVEFNGSVYNENGLDIHALIKHKEKTGCIKCFDGGETLEDDSPLYKKCDVLAPCAMEQQIHKNNCKKVNTKIIVEGANGPLTPNAHAYLTNKGVSVIPDMLANAGGVTVSYFEWLKNLQHAELGILQKRFDQLANQQLLKASGVKGKGKKNDLLQGASEKQIVYTALDNMMTHSYNVITDIAKKEELCMRMAAYKHSVENIYKTTKLSGSMF